MNVRRAIEVFEVVEFKNQDRRLNCPDLLTTRDLLNRPPVYYILVFDG